MWRNGDGWSVHALDIPKLWIFLTVRIISRYDVNDVRAVDESG